MGKDGRKKQSQVVIIINIFNSKNTRYLVKKTTRGKKAKQTRPELRLQRASEIQKGSSKW